VTLELPNQSPKFAFFVFTACGGGQPSSQATIIFCKISPSPRDKFLANTERSDTNTDTDTNTNQPNHIHTTLTRLREFSSDPNVAIIATNPNGSDPGVTCVTFEFDASDEVYYHALGDQCRAWLEDPGSGVVLYAAIRD
jgi:hypothetical protein